MPVSVVSVATMPAVESWVVPAAVVPVSAVISAVPGVVTMGAVAVVPRVGPFMNDITGPRRTGPVSRVRDSQEHRAGCSPVSGETIRLRPRCLRVTGRGTGCFLGVVQADR